MAIRSSARRMRGVNAALVSVALLLAACGGNDTAPAAPATPEASAPAAPVVVDNFPERPITFIVPAAAGGGMDTTMRRLQAAMASELGVNISVQNFAGAGTTIGVNYFLNILEGSRACYAYVLTNHPSLYIAPTLFDIRFTFDDLSPIGIPASNPAIWVVRNDSPYETLEDLIEAARQNPGRISMSSSSASLNNHAIGVFEVMDETGVEFNIVPFADGGSAARNALLRGEVDFTHTGLYNWLGIADQTRVLALQERENIWQAQIGDTRTVNEILGTDLGSAGSFYGFQAHRECEENHPERFAKMVEAYQNVVGSAEYQAGLEEVGEAGTVIPISPQDFLAASARRAEVEIKALELYGPRFEAQ
jgi:tripartite-type tricarboxylate transporter receptor subunit TctC